MDSRKASNHFTPRNKHFQYSILAIIAALICASVSMGIHHSRTAKHQREPLTAATQQRILASLIKMPLRFEANQGQTDPSVKFITKGAGYNLFLTTNELVFTSQNTNLSTKQSIIDTQRDTSPQPTTINVLRAQFIGANLNHKVTGNNRLASITNYYLGKDPKKWYTHIPSYGTVAYQNIYPGIDATFYGNAEQLEYDIHVQPKTNPNVLRLGFVGAKNLNIDAQGNLILGINSKTTLTMLKPVIYQEIHGIKHNCSGSFTLFANNQVGFKIGDYDKTQALIIDPLLVYSTYLGGQIQLLSGQSATTSAGYGITMDDSGNAYVVGATDSVGFPPAMLNYAAYNFPVNVFVTKINADGNWHTDGTTLNSSVNYTTILGGDTENTYPSVGKAIAIDSEGNAYVTGNTQTATFPNTTNSYQSSYTAGNTSAFFTKLNQTGTILYSTYLHGTDTLETTTITSGNSIAVEHATNPVVYLTGSTTSPSFPTTPNAYQKHTDYPKAPTNAFMTVFNPFSSGDNSLLYSTYLGATSTDSSTTEAYGIAVNGNPRDSIKVYLTGVTNSAYFPQVSAFRGPGGNTQAFITIFSFSDTESANPVFSSYFGLKPSETDSSDTQGNGIALDNLDNFYVTGFTTSQLFYTTAEAYQTNPIPGHSAFVAKFLNNTTVPYYSTYLHANTTDGSDTRANSIAIDSTENAYITGHTNSVNFPTAGSPFQSTLSLAGDTDVFIAKFNPEGSALSYSTYLGSAPSTALDPTPGARDNEGNGIAVNANSFNVVGSTNGALFPATTNSISASLNQNRLVNLPPPTSNQDAFVARFLNIDAPNYTSHKTKVMSTNGQRDVFDVIANSNLTGGTPYIWATAHDKDSNDYEQIYLNTDPTSVEWMTSCSSISTPNTTIAGLFGIDKTNLTGSTNPSLTSAYLPTSVGAQRITSSTPTTCAATSIADTTNPNMAGYLQLPPDYPNGPIISYYIKHNGINPNHDAVVFRESYDEGQTWSDITPINIIDPDPLATTLHINAIDGAYMPWTTDHAIYGARPYDVYIGTDDGFYHCQAGDDFSGNRSCTSGQAAYGVPWNPNGWWHWTNIGRVTAISYKYTSPIPSDYNASILAKSLLIVGSNKGLFVSVDGANLLSTPLSPNPTITDENYYITKIATDNSNIYATWFHTSAPAHKSKSTLSAYTPTNLIQNICNPSAGKPTAGIDDGGLTIAKVYYNDPKYPGDVAHLEPLAYYNYANHTNDFFGPIFLGVTALVNSNGNATHIYTADLGLSCNGGGIVRFDPSDSSSNKAPNREKNTIKSSTNSVNK